MSHYYYYYYYYYCYYYYYFDDCIWLNSHKLNARMMQLHCTQVKVKFSLCVTNWALGHEGVFESGCIDPRILDLDTSWRWVVSLTLRSRYPQERASGTHLIGCWVSPRTSVDDVERRKILSLPRLKLRPLGRPARSQSLFRLPHCTWMISKWIGHVACGK
jgi:hypothetical protein